VGLRDRRISDAWMVAALSRQAKLQKLEDLLSKQPTGPADVETKMKAMFAGMEVKRA